MAGQNALVPDSIPIEEIARYPLPGMAIPGSLAFSPDDRLITYLHSPERSLVRQLFAFDPATREHRLLVEPPEGGATEQNVSLEEALRRERQRQRELGVTPVGAGLGRPVCQRCAGPAAALPGGSQ
jgi:dipeptidyl-peptidase-4